MKIQLGSIEPNPFKKHIEGGRIDVSRVEKVLESADRNEFWHGWHVREHNGRYQLLWGHHRLAAAIKLFGKNFEVSAITHDLTDEQMFSSLANENVKDDNPQEKTDVIEFAQKYLQEHPESCKVLGHVAQNPEKGGRPHEHGSPQCIASFLGEKNWPLTTIKRYIKIATLPPDIKAKVAPPTGSRKDVGHGIKPGELRQSDAVALADLAPAAQRAAFKVLENLNNNDKGVVFPTVIPAAEVKRVVGEVKDLPKEKQPEVVAKKLKDAGHEAKLRGERERQERKNRVPHSPVKRGPDTSLLQMIDRVIKEGQRALAAKLHPDKGGSNEQMAKLNAAVTWLRLLISNHPNG